MRGTYPDHGEKDADRAEDSCGGCNARDLLRKIQPIDGHVEGGENTVTPLWSLEFFSHSRNAGELRRGGAARRL